MATPAFPGVGTQSRIADVQAQQSAFNLQQEALNRQSGQQLLNLLAQSGIDIADLVERSRQAGAQRAFETTEREAGQEFRAGESALERGARAGEITAERGFRTTEREAGQEFTVERDKQSARTAAAVAVQRLKDEQQLAREATGRIPQEEFERSFRGLVTQIIADLTDPETGLTQEGAQETVDAAVQVMVRNFPDEAAASPAVQPFIERAQRGAEIETRRALRPPRERAKARFLEEQRPQIQLEERTAVRRERSRALEDDIRDRMRRGVITPREATQELLRLRRPGPLDALFPDILRRRELQQLELLGPVPTLGE